MQVIIRELSRLDQDKGYTVGMTGELLKYEVQWGSWYIGVAVQFDDGIRVYHRVKLAEVGDG